LPDVPTFAELGFKNVEAAALVGIVAPAGTPPDVVSTLQKQLAEAINHPPVRQKLIDFGIEPVANTPAQYADLLRSETAIWHKIIKQQNISLD
jgi:tripartite-type tricarboxylate transporter receptor subunit TctC